MVNRFLHFLDPILCKGGSYELETHKSRAPGPLGDPIAQNYLAVFGPNQQTGWTRPKGLNWKNTTQQNPVDSATPPSQGGDTGSIPLGLHCGLDPIRWTAVMTMRPVGCGLSVDLRISVGLR